MKEAVRSVSPAGRTNQSVQEGMIGEVGQENEKRIVPPRPVQDFTEQPLLDAARWPNTARLPVKQSADPPTANARIIGRADRDVKRAERRSRRGFLSFLRDR